MSYSTKFIMGFDNDLNEFYEIYMDYNGYVGNSSEIIGAVQSLVIRSTTGDQNKLQPVLGTELLFQIFIGKATILGNTVDDSSLSIYDFTAQHDNDIRCTVYKNRDYTKIIYQGFVVVEDNSQDFQDPPYTINLRALDGLGLLKQVDMVDTNGVLYTGNLSVRDWLGNILYKTGQTLNLRIYFPFYPTGANSLLCSLAQVYLNAITWQTGELITTTDPSIDVAAAEADDAGTALEKICRCFRARLFQEAGVWNFVSLYSYVDPNGFAYDESSGTLTSGYYTMATVATGMGLNYDAPVGFDQILHPTQNDAMVWLKLATKWVKLSYTYDQSPNKVCNQDFTQGNANHTYDGTISSTYEDPSIIPAVTFNTKGWDLFCWTGAGGTNPGSGGGNSGTVPFPASGKTADIYVREVLDLLGYDENRYLVITTKPIANYVKSSTFLIDVNDIIQVSCDFRTKINISNIGSNPTWINVFYILMRGDDGSYWAYGDFGVSGIYKWWPCDSNYNLLGGPNYPAQNYLTYSNDLPTTAWTNLQTLDPLSITAPNNQANIRCPVSGTAFIILPGLPPSFTSHPTDAQETWFKNLRVTIYPYLQGSYKQLKGDYNFSSSNNTIKQTAAETVEISDSPKRYFKGALLQSNGNLWVAQWHRVGVFENARFQQLMEKVYFSNVYRIFQKIEGQIRGLTYVTKDLTVKQAGYLNVYYFTDHPIPTKKFILTSFENNYATGEGRRVFVEIAADQNDNGFISPDVFDFQYIFQ